MFYILFSPYRGDDMPQILWFWMGLDVHSHLLPHCRLILGWSSLISFSGYLRIHPAFPIGSEAINCSCRGRQSNISLYNHLLNPAGFRAQGVKIFRLLIYPIKWTCSFFDRKTAFKNLISEEMSGKYVNQNDLQSANLGITILSKREGNYLFSILNG